MVWRLRAVAVAVTGCALAGAAVGWGESQTGTGSSTVSVEGMEMHYRVVGAGEPLVLLHGGIQSGEMFDPFVPDLSSEYRLIIPDLRGHGSSTNPDGRWDTRQFARDVFALLDHLGVERFRAVGVSAGGMTLLHMATQQPQRVVAMVVVGVGTSLPASCREVLARTDVDAYAEPVWAKLRARHTHGDEQIRALHAWIASLSRGPDDMSFTAAQLAPITAATLVVHGDRDYCFPASMAWDIYSAIPEAYLWVVPNGGHVPIDGALAPQFSATVRAFFAGEWDH